MNRVYLSAIAAVMLTVPASADTVLGCEVKQATNGNYFNLVDPNCSFNGSVHWGGDDLHDFSSPDPETVSEEPTEEPTDEPTDEPIDDAV